MKSIELHKDKLKYLCEKFHVAELHVFGSVATESFNNESDIDFLVRFSGVDPLEYFDNYMDFKSALASLFSRKIDLVEVQTIKNPILKRAIDRDKIKLYGREDSVAAYSIAKRGEGRIKGARDAEEGLINGWFDLTSYL